MGNHKNIFLLSAAILIFAAAGCKPDKNFFVKPESLAGPVYQQLESIGKFTQYLKLLDRTPYGEILKKSGSWTIFCPTDSAINVYLQQNGYSTVTDMPWNKVSAIVKYSIISGAYNSTSLTYWSGQWYEGAAMRRRTQVKDTIMEMDANDYPTYLNWQNRKYLVDPSYDRYKTTNYWIPVYMKNPPVQYSDYEFVFGRPMTADNIMVQGAKVINRNVSSENGMIFALDKVVEPVPNYYQNLTSPEYGGKYSMYKRMIDRFGQFQFWRVVQNSVTGSMDSIYRQQFYTGSANNYLAYPLNDENMPFIISVQDHTENTTTGIIVPTNDALTNYLSTSILGKYYTSYDDMPLDLVGMFINVNFFRQFFDIMPSRFGNVFNLGLEKIDLKLENIVDKKFCSNGLFYGINKVFTTNSFSTVIGPMILDTSYTIMYKAIKDLGIESALKGTGIDFSVMGVKNTQYMKVPDPNSDSRLVSVVAYKPDLSVIYLKVEGDATVANNRIYPNPASTTPDAGDMQYVSTTLKSITLNQIINGALDLSINNYYQSQSGDIVYVSGSTTMQGGGNIKDGTSVNINSVLNMQNGKVYNMSSFIKMPTRYTVGVLKDNGPNFSKFLQVLKGADLLLQVVGNATDSLIGLLDLNKSYTLLAPNNTAVTQAITDGVIPNPSPAYLNTLNAVQKATARAQFDAFARKHFITRAIPTDGKTSGTFSSLYVSAIVDLVPQYQEYTIQNNYSTSSLDIKNADTGALLLSTGTRVNKLSRKVVIHEINTYLR